MSKNFVIYIRCRKEIYIIWKELIAELIKYKNRKVSSEEVLIELLKSHQIGKMLLRKYKLNDGEKYLW